MPQPCHVRSSQSHSSTANAASQTRCYTADVASQAHSSTADAVSQTHSSVVDAVTHMCVEEAVPTESVAALLRDLRYDDVLQLVSL